MDLRQVLRKHYALPSEHGAWIWLLGPFVLGWAAGDGFSWDLALLLAAGLAAFLLRQPLTILVKVTSGRRSGKQQYPALLWSGLYGLLAGLFLGSLIWRGHGRLGFLAIPGLVVFTWHLWLVRGRQERGQMGIEIVAAGVLALLAPAAYWVSGGDSPLGALLLWAVAWFQAAASIVHVYLRLFQRQLRSSPALRQRLKMGSRSLGYSVFNSVASLGLSLQLGLPLALPLAFALQSIDVVDGVLRPATGQPPRAIGLRQLVASSLFVLVAGYAFANWRF